MSTTNNEQGSFTRIKPRRSIPHKSKRGRVNKKPNPPEEKRGKRLANEAGEKRKVYTSSRPSKKKSHGHSKGGRE